MELFYEGPKQALVLIVSPWAMDDEVRAIQKQYMLPSGEIPVWCSQKMERGKYAVADCNVDDMDAEYGMVYER
ncbi:hypothetical protein [Psychrobacter sp. PAMC 21119]|uniref:hypothetical protein n=1 Tax=Psychrobacter sp. PAMC 21119 TaxID=1112209 RepID=UPI000288553F|nr:hypothetical protein [Psychrobacter sp. PAMC 21119]